MILGRYSMDPIDASDEIRRLGPDQIVVQGGFISSIDTIRLVHAEQLEINSGRNIGNQWRELMEIWGSPIEASTARSLR